VSGGSLSGGTWMVPSLLIPTYSSLELTLMAGIEIETGSDLVIAGPRITVDPGSRAFGGAGTAPQAVAEQARPAVVSALASWLGPAGPM
jgi:hypothetical protein